MTNWGRRDEPVPEELQSVPCLSAGEIRKLVEAAEQLESFFRNPQDIEWSIDRNGELVVLQCRPLRTRAVESVAPQKVAEALKSYPRRMEQVGMVACRGIGGRAGHVRFLR